MESERAAGCDIQQKWIKPLKRKVKNEKTNRESQNDDDFWGEIYRGKTKTSGLVGVLLSTAFLLHPDCCHYCQLAQHMAHGTWLMMAHYVSLIKNRSLSEISHQAGDEIAPSLSRSTAIIKEQNLLNLMDTSCSFWEVFEYLIVFILINARSKLNYCAMSHPFGRVTVWLLSLPAQESWGLFIIAVV